MAASGPNAEQITCWNALSGPRWVEMQEVMDGQIAALGEAAMDRLAPSPGQRVLDVGCGCGATTLELARRVGPEGEILGVDVSVPMLLRARERAAEAGLSQIRFLEADAQTEALPGSHFDALYSRFGVMFFAEPAAAFQNLSFALRPAARLGFVCWQALELNPFMTEPLAAVTGLIPLPPPVPPGAPGPFAFADADKVRGILAAANFDDVGVESLTGELLVGPSGDLDEAVTFALGLGPVAAAVRAAKPDVETLGRVRDAVRARLALHHGERGVTLPFAAWLVTGRLAEHR